VSEYPRRLIEVDLPIARISSHSRREKSIHQGHISALHIWWARRPLAACRAVTCASLWPDPVDLAQMADCDGAARARREGFLQTAREEMARRAAQGLAKASAESLPRLVRVQKDPGLLADPIHLRGALLDFVADFSDWDNSTDHEYLSTARRLTRAAHEALGAEGGVPLVMDPFAGGGAIPLEALRLGAEVFASDLNPVSVLLNRVILEYVPKYGEELAQRLRHWGQWVQERAKKEIGHLYPSHSEAVAPMAYLWARTVVCEGPGCGAHIPLIGTVWLSRSRAPRTWVQFEPSGDGVGIRLLDDLPEPHSGDGLTRGNNAFCPVCGYITGSRSVKRQLAERGGGTRDARLFAVVSAASNGGLAFNEPTDADDTALAEAGKALEHLSAQSALHDLPLIPDESAPPDGALGFRFQPYGIRKWAQLYTERQLVALATFAHIVSSPDLESELKATDADMSEAIRSCLALNVGRVNDRNCSLCRWRPDYLYAEAANGGQNRMPMMLDFAETNPFSGRSGDWLGSLEWIAKVIEREASALSGQGPARTVRSPAQTQVLPDDSAHFVFTDPPYYDAFGYSDLSEFFYIWLSRCAPSSALAWSRAAALSKGEEAIVVGRELADGRGEKSHETYLRAIAASADAARKCLVPDGIAAFVFASKATAAWEAMLQALVDTGWIVTASWPLDTEMASRSRAQGSAALQSSIHLICRPRETSAGVLTETVGDWRDVLAELPIRIHDWMPRLAEEGVVGADAIFACLGPALEVFSRYSRVEKASGEPVLLREYLEHVWAAVSREALSMIFDDPDTAGFEPDARLTAMWLWTLGVGGTSDGGDATGGASPNAAPDEAGQSHVRQWNFAMQYDAARKIAQGLGIDLDKATSIVAVKGEQARLLGVAERAGLLFGTDTDPNQPVKRPEKIAQLGLFEQLQELDAQFSAPAPEAIAPEAGDTVLDRLHQAMILFAAGRGEALRRFLVEDGIGQPASLWKLAQALSALYPAGSDEKRWVDGVLARKKGLGL